MKNTKECQKNIQDKKLFNMKILIIRLFPISILLIIITIYLHTNISEAYSNEVNEQLIKREINIKEILEKNKSKLRKEEIKKDVVNIEYTTKYIENSELPKGIIQVIQEGTDGNEETYIKSTYIGEDLVKVESVKSKIVKPANNKIVEIGTAKYTNKSKIKVGDKIYSTTSILPIRVEPSDNSSKLISINKNTEVKLLQKQKDWYKVQYNTYVGWSKAECFTNLTPKTEIVEEINSNKNHILNKLSFNMELNKPSGLSLEQFKNIFKNEPKDKNNVFQDNAQYFYYAEKQYNINGVFLAAVAIHESNWGTSKISRDKKNLFGYGAYDSSPYYNSYTFNTYSEGIDLLARVFSKYYLNPKGTKIYDGNLAEGNHYNGPTLSGVNKKYASDKNWAKGVYSWMKYLYNKI